jgi:FkbM family methyltransferase
MYSQNEEEKYIVEFLDKLEIQPGQKYIGGYLSIGENDGITLSNTKALHDLGWKGLCIEPSKNAYEKLLLNQPNSICLNYAVSDFDGPMDFYESGTHLKQGDTSLLSSLKREELSRWDGTDNEFTKTTCTSISVETLMNIIQKLPITRYEFISIDAEGVDIEILKQLDLTKMGCRLLCIEWNSNEEVKKQILEYTSSFGMTKIIYQSDENLLICREQ